MDWQSGFAKPRPAEAALAAGSRPAAWRYAPALLRRLALAGLLTFGAELACAYLWPAPRQREFDASILLGPGESPPLRVVALGDSTLTAPGLSRADDIWIRSVLRQVVGATGRSVDFRSFGMSGSTSGDVLRHQLPLALELEPQLAFVSVGSNDLIRGVPVGRLARNLDGIVGRLRGAGAQVIMSGVGDLGTIPRLAPPLRQMARRLGRRGDRVHALVARRHGAVKADQWRWAAHQFAARKDVWSMDRFHPSAAGHQIWAATCWEVVEPLCARLALD